MGAGETKMVKAVNSVEPQRQPNRAVKYLMVFFGSLIGYGIYVGLIVKTGGDAQGNRRNFPGYKEVGYIYGPTVFMTSSALSLLMTKILTILLNMCCWRLPSCRCPDQ